MNYSFKSITGNYRETNQDRAAFFKNNFGQHLAIVCDGMGGHYGGEVAANIAIESISSQFLQKNFHHNDEKSIIEWIKIAISNAYNQMELIAKNDYKLQQMGTTVVAAVVVSKKTFLVNIGDSRAYYYNSRTLQQLTKDQNLLNLLIDQKADIDTAKTKYNVYALTSVLGPNKEATLDISVFENKINGYLILTTDGVHQSITKNQFLGIMKDNRSIDQKIDSLIKIALRNGSTDNLSVVIAQYQDE